MRTLILSILLTLAAIFSAQAAEVDRSKMNHSEMLHGTSLTTTTKIQKNVRLKNLTALPTSGKAREGGYDGRYVMESTDVANTLSIRCAQASRGLVMMSNAEWARCGGKPDGAAQQFSQPIKSKGGVVNEHAGHNM